MDLIGPWRVDVKGKEVEFNALTCVDPVTNIVELVRIDNKTARHISQLFTNTWLSRYLWPKKCVHDNGGEFIGWEFQRMLEKAKTRDRPTTSRNPQANAICERMHQTVGNILRTLLHGHEVADDATAQEIVDNALATAQHVTRCAASRSLGSQAPGALAFGRDMFLNIPLIADLQALQQRRKMLIDNNLQKQNARRRHCDYSIGDQVCAKAVNPAKLEARGHGPYPVTRVHANGTVTIQRAPYIRERINLRRIYPHRVLS